MRATKVTPHKEGNRIFEPTPEGLRILGELIKSIRRELGVQQGLGKELSRAAMLIDIQRTIKIGMAGAEAIFREPTLKNLEDGSVSPNIALISAISAMRYDVPSAKNPATGRHWTSQELIRISWGVINPSTGEYLVGPEELDY